MDTVIFVIIDQLGGGYGDGEPLCSNFAVGDADCFVVAGKRKVARQQIAAELPDLVLRERRMREAAEENTFSGELRRAIHGGERDLISLAELVGTTPIQLSEFLAGDRTLRSDVLDRLVSALGARLVVSASELSSR